MRLEQPFLKLPLRFDAEALANEVRALPKDAWVAHPTGFEGNEAVRLVTVRGEPTDDFKGPMARTEYLAACTYVREIMTEIGGVWGRSRFMGLGPGGQVPQHVDSHYYWRTHWRIHVPVITNPAVAFSCGPETVHMAPGECWTFDSFRWHKVVNGGNEQRIHLVLDTVGGERLWELMDSARSGAGETKLVAPGERMPGELAFEQVNAPRVMSPWEIRTHVRYLLDRTMPDPLLEPVTKRLDRFMDDWTVAWAQFGTDDAGWPAYVDLLEAVKRDLASLRGGGILLRNQLQLYLALDHMVLSNVLDENVPVETAEGEPLERRLAS